MADSFAEDVDSAPTGSAADLEMEEATDAREETNADETAVAAEEAPEEEAPVKRMTFLSHLKSPIVTLIVGSGDSETILSAHQSLLVQSPFFLEACNEFSGDGSPRQIDLSTDDLDAVGCFLEFLYTGDYFPRKVPGQRQLENDPAVPKVDESGDQLLKHAKVYTLAERFGLPTLAKLASSKIHCVNSTAKGEIAYARYVYEFTSKDDTTIRGPVANFWAMRSHTLRAEAEEEFRSLCLEFPQFGYDILTRVLDDKLKRERNEKMNPASASGRKRPRHSNV